ncbi:MAG: dihydroorotate dehydrogenase [Candidatus Aquicultor primus]|uniref:Dihydroorotate dehydrogenase n=1 Tax=Candidatus Aquicultor primus TaxID=1797195 RepID=A0A1F2UKS2_9ACTN|nr:MAG: dihydroorotate dehydrogenase [Candidatus Aquicultor primus]HCG98854.1 ZIP family metal transporter [Actinomycetota bacterium]
MIESLQALHPILQALVATIYTWAMTALGAATVFLTKGISRRMLDGMLGFAAGVMIAISYWSLLAPAIEMSRGTRLPAWFPAATGFLVGALFLYGLDKVLPHLHLGAPTAEAEGVATTWRRATLLIMAITLHNIPEGLAVGVAFGVAAADTGVTTVSAAFAVALGIGMHNFPEGAVVAIPLRCENISRAKSFFYGQLTAVVEPVAAVVGASAVLLLQPIMPYALAFAAGAMLFVVIEEVVPESQRGGNADFATIGAILGFLLMMILEVVIG